MRMSVNHSGPWPGSSYLSASDNPAAAAASLRFFLVFLRNYSGWERSNLNLDQEDTVLVTVTVTRAAAT